MVNPRPTRAEISDVANAIYDGTSAIMLSGETAAGAYPVEALKTMSAIAERTENEPHYRDERFKEAHGQISVSDATAHAACLTAKDVNASAIVTVSESGNTARLLSKYRPTQPIIACVMDEHNGDFIFFELRRKNSQAVSSVEVEKIGDSSPHWVFFWDENCCCHIGRYDCFSWQR